MNYTEIQEQVRSILKRGTTLDSDIPIWIGFAESQIKADLRDSKSAQTITSTLLTGADTIAYPSTIELTAVYLVRDGYPEELANMQTLEPADTSTGEPCCYTVDGDMLRFDAIADQDYTIKIQCFSDLDIATTTTNWVGDEVPDCYIYGALMHSTVKTASGNGNYAQMFELALNKAKRLNAKRKGQSTLRTDIPSSTNTFQIARGW